MSIKKHIILPALPYYLLGYMKHYIAENFTIFRIIYLDCFLPPLPINTDLTLR